MAVGMGGNGLKDDRPGVLGQARSEAPARPCQLAAARSIMIFLLLVAAFWAGLAALIWLL
jgi:hypothetical protein